MKNFPTHSTTSTTITERDRQPETDSRERERETVVQFGTLFAQCALHWFLFHVREQCKLRALIGGQRNFSHTVKVRRRRSYHLPATHLPIYPSSHLLSLTMLPISAVPFSLPPSYLVPLWKPAECAELCLQCRKVACSGRRSSFTSLSSLSLLLLFHCVLWNYFD